MTNSNGNIQQQSVYYPFGGERVITNTVANNYRFTGLERDSESGLDHTLNRQLSSSLGRWLSPDPVRGCVMNPQNFDLYSYVLNDPTTLTDPLGLQCSDLVNGVINCTSTASGSDTGPGSTLWDLEFGGGSDSPGQPLLYRGGGARGGGGPRGGLPLIGAAVEFRNACRKDCPPGTRRVFSKVDYALCLGATTFLGIIPLACLAGAEACLGEGNIPGCIVALATCPATLAAMCVCAQYATTCVRFGP